MSATKTVFILGSARGDSNTEKALRKVYPDISESDLIDLRQLRLEHYDYDPNKNIADDFLAIAERMKAADTIVFATPVYWYAMSAQMKVLFDRFSDLLSIHKPIGKSLRGKKVVLVATGSDAELPEGFETPFESTANYFDMVYVGARYLAARDL